ncbi:MAG: hypothetical protein JKY61_07290, partial [Planctomycetes bacterium]|nr:hypothetical protein [Planctomycetota bacterium]
APNGSVWGATDRALYSVSLSGVPDKVFGNAYKVGTLESGYRSWVDHLGRIFIQDGETELWHGFDSTGDELFVCPFPSHKESWGKGGIQLTIDMQGQIHMNLDGDRSGHFQYSKGGEPITSITLHDGYSWYPVHFELDEGSRWVAGDVELARLSAKGRVLASIKRRPDGHWWNKVGGMHLSFRGRKMVVTDKGSQYSSQTTPMVALYDQDGGNGLALALPEPWMYSTARASADWVLLTFREEIALYHIADQTLRIVDAPKTKSCRDWFFSPDETELWGIYSEGLGLRRYALPRE